MLLDAMATTSSPLAAYSVAYFANSERMCFTNGQCLQMKATSTALLPVTSASETVLPLKSGSENDGSDVPRSSMVDGVSGIGTPRMRNPDYIVSVFPRRDCRGPRHESAPTSRCDRR